MKDRARKGCLRKFAPQVTLCLAPAVVISAAYLVYMFQWTTHQTNLEEANRSLQAENDEMSNAFRGYVKDYIDLVEILGIAEEEKNAETVTVFNEGVAADLKRINNTLSPPLPPPDLNFMNLIRELEKQKAEVERANHKGKAEMAALRKRHKAEMDDVRLEALIQFHQIERLKKRIAELEGKK
ncbi:MAG: hypothetical protein ACYTHM_03270 [Planctomycetota bacterium]|jgi:hypothetical protein